MSRARRNSIGIGGGRRMGSVRIVSRRTERCSRDGGRLASELEEEVEVEVDAVRGGEVDEKVIV
jgi:hypothetical protein